MISYLYENYACLCHLTLLTKLNKRQKFQQFAREAKAADKLLCILKHMYPDNLSSIYLRSSSFFKFEFNLFTVYEYLNEWYTSLYDRVCPEKFNSICPAVLAYIVARNKWKKNAKSSSFTYHRIAGTICSLILVAVTNLVFNYQPYILQASKL